MGSGLEFYTFPEIDAYKDFVERMKTPNLPFSENKLTEEEKLLIPFIIKDKYFPQLFKPYAVNLGCLMVKRKVIEAVPFRTHETFIIGEDIWWFNEANEKRFEFWCDSSHRCIHKNTEWETVMNKCPKAKFDFSIAHGPVNAEGIDILNRDLKPIKR
jgi:hypothetical protein